MALKQITDADFDATVQQGTVLVDFWAPWCAPCRMIAPVLEELQGELKGQVEIVKLNVDENPNSAMKYQTTSIPTLLLFRDGQLVERMVGAGTKEHIKNTIMAVA